MGPIRALDRLSSSSYRLWAAGVGFVAAIVLIAGFAIWNRHEEVFGSYRRELSNLGFVLAEQTARSLQAVDLVLQETQAEVLAAGIDNPEQFKRVMGTEKVHLVLHGRLENLPQADGIGLVGSDGFLVNGSRLWPTPVLDISDRDWYGYLRDHDAQGVIVSVPVLAKLSGAWTFFLVRRINAPGGRFLGIAVGAIQTRYFEEFFRAITLHSSGSVSIARRDGMILARYPHIERVMGEKIAAESPWYAHIAGGGTYRSPGYVDGVARVVSVHRLRDYPLAVTVTIAEAAALAEWRRQSIFIACGAIGMAVGVIVLFGTLAARSRRLERHAAELAEGAAALRQSEARFRDFAHTSSDWFWETDEHHRFSYLSDTIRGFGLDPRNHLGQVRVDNAADFESEPQKWRRHLAALDNHKPFRDFVYARQFGDEPVHMISVSGLPLFDARGRFLGYRGTARDVTDEVIAERRLSDAKAAAETANRSKSQFLANISHELRTPLNAIIGYSEMLELGMVGRLDPQQIEKVEIIHQSGKHLHEIINDILDLAKIDAGRLDLYDEPSVDPRRVIEACVALIGERAREAALTLWEETDPATPLLVADPTRLKQILLNLLSNAIKFTPPGGAISIGCHRADNGGVVFSVQDNGPGMTAAEIEIALEPFGQVDSSLARRYDGTGLGLPLARRLTELHGGSLSVRSEKGSGTLVTVTLPAARVMADDAPGQSITGVTAA